MVGLGHCHMTSKYGPSLSKAVGPVESFFLVVKKSHFNKKKIHLTAILITEGRKDCRMLPLEHSAILLTSIKQ